MYEFANSLCFSRITIYFCHDKMKNMTSQIQYIRNFNLLFEAHNKRFIRFAFSYVQDDDVAEDIVSESFMYYWENRESCVEKNISAYLLTIVKHKCLNYLKHLAIEQQACSDSKSIEEWDLQVRIDNLEACDPQELLSQEIQQLVTEAVQKMPELTRTILISSRYHSKTNKEISEEMNLSVKAVEYHITKALKILRVVLKDYFPIWALYFYQHPL